MRLLLLCVLGVGSFYPSSAFGEIIDKPTEICKAAQSGKRGAWVDDAFLKKCLKLDVDSAFITSDNANLKLQLDSFKRENDLLKDTVSKNKDEITKMALQVTEQEKLADKYREETKRWYRNPWIMSVLGVAIGGAAVTTIVLVTHK